MPQPDDKQPNTSNNIINRFSPAGLAIGVGMGVTMGIAFQDALMGLTMGLSMAMVFGLALGQQMNNTDAEPQDTPDA